jgi:hypothetical protein
VAVVNGWMLAGDGWCAGVLVCWCALPKFLVMRVRAARSNLIWLYKLVEGLRSDATVT